MEYVALLNRLVKDFNEYSKLVALNYAQIKEDKTIDEGVIQWNRGNLNRIDEYLEELADLAGVKLVRECGVHSFGYDDWKRELEYVTVHIETI